MQKPIRVVFMGTPAFAADVLEYLLSPNFAPHFKIVAIVTQPDRPKGRSGTPTPPDVKLLAQKIAPEIPLYQPEKASTPEFIAELTAHQPDLFAVVAYGEIIKQELLDLPTLGCINLHASLLPGYRGAAPMQRALMDGVTESGVTVIYMVKKMDAGGMIAIEKVAVPPEMNLEGLELALRHVGKELFAKTICEFAKGDRLPAVEQEIAKVTFAAKIGPEDCLIDWNRSATEIHNQIRALSPRPGAYSFIVSGEGDDERSVRIKILASKVDDGEQSENIRLRSEMESGTVVSRVKNEMAVVTGSGLLRLLEVQPEGKKAMSAEQFLQGYANKKFKFAGEHNTRSSE